MLDTFAYYLGWALGLVLRSALAAFGIVLGGGLAYVTLISIF